MCLDCYGLNFYCLVDWPDSVCHLCICLPVWTDSDQITNSWKFPLAVVCSVPVSCPTGFYKKITHPSLTQLVHRNAWLKFIVFMTVFFLYLWKYSHTAMSRDKNTANANEACVPLCPRCAQCAWWTVACVCVGPVLYMVDLSSCETLTNLMAWARNNFLSLSATGCCPCSCSFASTWCFTVKQEFLPLLHQSLSNHLRQLRVTFCIWMQSLDDGIRTEFSGLEEQWRP